MADQQRQQANIRRRKVAAAQAPRAQQLHLEVDLRSNDRCRPLTPVQLRIRVQIAITYRLTTPPPPPLASPSLMKGPLPLSLRKWWLGMWVCIKNATMQISHGDIIVCILCRMCWANRQSFIYVLPIYLQLFPWLSSCCFRLINLATLPTTQHSFSQVASNFLPAEQFWPYSAPESPSFSILKKVCLLNFWRINFGCHTSDFKFCRQISCDDSHCNDGTICCVPRPS